MMLKLFFVEMLQALKKAATSPAAFYKGIVLPLCKEGTCTLKEATIIAGVIGQVTIPPLHTAVALAKLTSMRYSDPTCVFIKTMLMKKGMLPVPVVQGLVGYFKRVVEPAFVKKVCSIDVQLAAFGK
jgi:essential nuclear protein 1